MYEIPLAVDCYSAILHPDESLVAEKNFNLEK